ncbi:MAG: creatininase family protein [Chloroflexia bacterium]
MPEPSETALVLALRPELVVEPRPAPRRRPAQRSRPSAPTAPNSTAAGRYDGYTDSPARATPERGQRYLDAAAQSLAAALIEFHAATQPPD